MWQALGQDLRYGIRRMAHNPGFAFLVALILAMVLATNFSISRSLDTAVLHPVPFPGVGRIVALTYT
ncbi:MAG TPA: hypothetical protein VJW51_06295 [Candidatus Acidoferrales bacterium]|nr:hypothetical protein [Candidatus Acidoferrales bacterium]